MASKKDQLIAQMQQETATANASRLLIAINHNCFERCVQKPSTSMSSGESSCYTNCMEKYMRSWDRVSQTYTSRLQQDAQTRNGLGNTPSFSANE